MANEVVRHHPSGSAATYHTLANAVVVLHVGVILLCLFGWVAPVLDKVYFTVLLVTTISELSFGYCILTKVEAALRQQAGDTALPQTGFLAHYLEQLTGKPFSPRLIGILVQVFLVVSLVVQLAARIGEVPY